MTNITVIIGFGVTAVQLVLNPFGQLVPQLELYSQLQLSLWSDPIAFSVLVLWTVIGGRVGYHGWTEFCYDWLKLDCCECLVQSGIWTSLDGQLWCIVSVIFTNTIL